MMTDVEKTNAFLKKLYDFFGEDVPPAIMADILLKIATGRLSTEFLVDNPSKDYRPSLSLSTPTTHNESYE
jgi:hypothetical protein